MKNDCSNNKGKNKCLLLLVLGIVFSLLFVLSVITVLWAVGFFDTTMKIIFAAILSAILVLLVSVIIWNTRISKKER